MTESSMLGGLHWALCPLSSLALKYCGDHSSADVTSRDKKLELGGSLTTLALFLSVGILVGYYHRYVTSAIQAITNPWLKGASIGGASLLGVVGGVMCIANILMSIGVTINLIRPKS